MAYCSQIILYLNQAVKFVHGVYVLCSPAIYLSPGKYRIRRAQLDIMTPRMVSHMRTGSAIEWSSTPSCPKHLAYASCAAA